MASSIYDIPLRSITGKDVSLKEFEGKVLLIVNVASKCGQTKQYAGLEKLYAQYRDAGLVVAGFPSNDFAEQEPGSNAEIMEFCRTNFGVEFPMFEKIKVSGAEKHPLYKTLTTARAAVEGAPTAALREKLSGRGIPLNPAPEVLWNFEKFIVSRAGEVVRRFSSPTQPEDPDFLAALKAELDKAPLQEGLAVETAEVDIKTQDGTCDCFIARPAGGGKYPAVLFFMDAYGPRARLYDMAKTLAAQGYYVLLPNLFYRVRRAPVVSLSFPIRRDQVQDAIQNHLMPLIQCYSPASGVRDAGVFLEFLARQKEADAGRVGITGYCMGGGMALRVAGRYSERIAAVASFHGGNLATQEPESPHRQLGNIKAELYIAHADNDRSMPEEQIERLHDALEQSGLKYAAEVYKDAPHGFTMSDLPAYNPAALEKHWAHVFDLFARTLKKAS